MTTLERESEQVANDIADVIAATAGVIFAILVAGVFAAASGGFVAVSADANGEVARRKTVRHEMRQTTP